MAYSALGSAGMARSATEGVCGSVEGRGILFDLFPPVEKILASGTGVCAREGKRSDWLSPYMVSRKAVAVYMCDSDTSATASDENAGAP
jgi:hypothetical protein